MPGAMDANPIVGETRTCKAAPLADTARIKICRRLPCAFVPGTFKSIALVTVRKPFPSQAGEPPKAAPAALPFEMFKLPCGTVLDAGPALGRGGRRRLDKPPSSHILGRDADRGRRGREPARFPGVEGGEPALEAGRGCQCTDPGS